jgi:hypothetical protein
MKKKKNNTEYKASLPDEIKVLFGKFYIFSFILIIFLGILFPFIIMERISSISRVMILVVLFLFYVYVVYDVTKKKKSFNSTIYILLITLVIASFVTSIIKMMS